MQSEDRLFDLLNELNDQELMAIWTKALRCKPDDKHFEQGTHASRVRAISDEWRSVHGHTLMNLRRTPHELQWKRILIDVADKLKPGLRWTSYSMGDNSTEHQIEQAIVCQYNKSAKRIWDKMDAQAKQKLAKALEDDLNNAEAEIMKSSQRIAVKSVTVSSLNSGIATGVMAGGLAWGVMSQVSVWFLIRVFGFWSGTKLAAEGGLAAVGGAVLSGPVAVGFVAQFLMATSYRKSIPATLMLLGFHEARRQIEAAAAES